MAINAWTRALAGVAASALVLGAGSALAQPAQQQPQAPETPRPNILILVADDLGWSDIGAYGGEIRTPNLDQLAADGLMFTQFYAHASCSPTRSMLLSGTDNHLAGVGQMNRFGNNPVRGGYDAVLRADVAALPEVLQSVGYQTIMAGKWHLGEAEGYRPHERGFEDSLILLQAGASMWNQSLPQGFMNNQRADYLLNGEPYELPADWYASTGWTDFIIDSIEDGLDDDRPFFVYAAFNAPHWPVGAPEEDILSYRGAYEVGYEAIIAGRLARQQELGIAPAWAPAEPIIEPVGGAMPWSALSDAERAQQAREMEVFAATVTALDREMGRIIQYLRDSGQYDNTVIVFMSDNGAEGVRRGGALDSAFVSQFDNSLENMGLPNSFVQMGSSWAQVSGTPNRFYKYTAFEGGYHVPAIISWPGVTEPGTVTDAFATVMDLYPTFLEMAGTRHPGLDFFGRTVQPIRGMSMVPFLSGEDTLVHSEDYVFGWEINNFVAIRKGDWKLVRHPQFAGSQEFQLYNLTMAGGERVDLSAEYPDVFQEMMREYRQFVTANNVHTNAQGLPSTNFNNLPPIQ